MSISKAFTFLFEDDEWIVKIAIAAVLTLIPIVGWIPLIGWMLEIGRRVATGRADVLPAWDDLSTYAIRGIKAFVVSLVYAIPYLLLFSCAYGLPWLAASLQVSEGVHTIFNIVSIAATCVNLVYYIFMALVVPAALMRFTMNDDNITAGLAFKEVLTLVKDNLPAYFTIFLGNLILSLIMPLGALILCVGIFFTVPYSVAVLGHLYGQAYAEATGGGIVPTGTPPAAPAASADWEG